MGVSLWQREPEQSSPSRNSAASEIPYGADTWEAATPGTVKRMTAAIPLGRMAEPRQIAQAAAWLLSERASYVTGAILPVNGGAGA